jgi:hypothetical protein
MKKLSEYIDSRPIFFNTSPVPPILRTSDDPSPAPAAGGTPRYLECDFCHCKLTRTGEVYQVSEQAREFRDEKEKHGKAVIKLDEEIVNLRVQIAAKDSEIAALKGSGTTQKKTSFL